MVKKRPEGVQVVEKNMVGCGEGAGTAGSSRGSAARWQHAGRCARRSAYRRRRAARAGTFTSVLPVLFICYAHAPRCAGSSRSSIRHTG